MKGQNLELKNFCKDFGDIRKVLKSIGAKKELIKKQKDYFLYLSGEKQKQKARLKLRVENNKMFLIYYERPNFSSKKDTTSDIVLIKTNKNMLDFLTKSLGILGIVEKKREVWRKGYTVFHLDDVSEVGKIFEIELRKSGKIVKRDRDMFSDYRKTVSPFLGKVVKGSNIDLTLEKKKVPST